MPGVIGSLFLLTVFVLGTLAIWVSSDQGPQRVANSYEASKYQVNAQERIQATCVGHEGTGFAECLFEIEQSERDNHNTQKDIGAQRYMAIWAFVMAFAAIGTMGVTAVGLTWIKATLDETRRAVDSADDAVAVAREIGEAQVRAYASITSGSVSICPPNLKMAKDYHHYFPKIDIVVKNYGNTPALWFQTSFEVRYSPPLNGKFKGTLNFPPMSWGKEIGAGEELEVSQNLHHAPLKESELAIFDSGELHIDMIVGYKFRDVFGRDIVDERVFTSYFRKGEIGVPKPLMPHPFDRKAIEELIQANN